MNERAEHKTRRTPETAGETRGYTTPTVLGSPSPGANLLSTARPVPLRARLCKVPKGRAQPGAERRRREEAGCDNLYGRGVLFSLCQTERRRVQIDLSARCRYACFSNISAPTAPHALVSTYTFSLRVPCRTRTDCRSLLALAPGSFAIVLSFRASSSPSQ